MTNNERVGRVRKGRRDSGYTVVQNSLINHPELSIEARGLIIYLLSRPEDWVLRVSDVRRFLGCAGKPCGKNKSYAIIAELKRQRYIVMCEDLAGNHFAGVTYYIYDEPVSDPTEVQRRHSEGDDALSVPLSPLPENREAAKSSLPGFPHPEKGEAVISKDNIQNPESPLPPKRKTRRRKGSGEAAPDAENRSVSDIKPWTVVWTEIRIRKLMAGPEKEPPKPTSFIQSLIAKGGDVGRREQLNHQAKTCWPSVALMDLRAKEYGRGIPLPQGMAFDVDALADAYHSVPIDSSDFTEWQTGHADRGWPTFPTPDRATHVWLPKAGAAALNVPNDRRVSA